MANYIETYRGAVLKETIQIDEKTTFFKKLMSDHRITCDVFVSAVLDIKIGDHIVWNTYNYTVNRLPTVDKISNSSYHYTIYFEANVYDLLKKIFISIDGLADFALNENATGFLSKIVDCINITQTGWTGTVTGESGTYKTLQFANESCKSALTRVAQAFGFEFDVVGKAISLKATIGSALGYSFEYGRNNGLYKIERQQVADQNIITKVWGFGSTKNIPSSYRDGAQRLVFEVDGKRYLEAETDYGIIEGQFTDENIYPRWPGVLSGVNIVFDGGSSPGIARVDRLTRYNEAGDSIVSCNGYTHTMVWTTDVGTTLENFVGTYGFEYGDVTLQLLEFVGNFDVLFIANHPGTDFEAVTIDAHGEAINITANQEASAGGTEFSASKSYVEDSSIYFDLNSEQVKGEAVMKIVFTSGACSGIEFEIYKFDFATRRVYFNAYVDQDGTSTPRYNDGAPIQPETGDTYTFVNINLPQEYIDAAELELKNATQAYLDANKDPQVVYTVDIDPKYALTETIDDINPGDTVEVTDAELIGVSPITIRIASLEYPLVNIYKIKAVISDYVPYTFNEQIIKTVVTNSLNNIFLERRLAEMIRESELRQKRLMNIKEIITFTNDSTPTISSYQSIYAPIHGQYPTVRLVIILDAGSEYQSMQNPIITKVNGLIDTIYFDIGEPTNGYIILQ